MKATPGNASATLTWEAPSFWGTWTAAGFEVAVKQGQPTFRTVFDSDDSDLTSYVFREKLVGNMPTGRNGDVLSIRIRAVSQKDGTDGTLSSHFQFSSWVTITGITVGVPAKIADSALTVTPGNAKLDLSWTAPSNNGSAISGYDVHYTSAAVANDAAVQTGGSATAATGWVNSSRSGATASQSITDLTNNTTYRVRVRAKNTHGDGAWVFGTGTARPPTRTAPSVPQSVKATPGNASATLSWQPPSSWGTEEASAYWIQWRFTTGPDRRWINMRGARLTAQGGITTSTNVIAVVFSGRQIDSLAQQYDIANGTSYDFRIAAESHQISTNDFLYSSWVTITGIVPGIPAAISSSALTATPGNKKLDLSWTAPSGNGSAISGYDVNYTSATVNAVANNASASGNDPAAAWVAVSRSGVTASQSITGLTNSETYRVRVRAKNTHGDGAWVFGKGVPRERAPGEPTGLTVTSENAKLDLSWTAPIVGVVTDYDVHYTSATVNAVANNASVSGNDPSAAWVAVSRSGATASQSITGLDNGTAYRVRVRARNAVGDGAWVFGKGVPLLPAPTNLTISPGDGELRVSWALPPGVESSEFLNYDLEGT